MDGIRLGHKPQEKGLLMWEGAYLSRTKESVFSWELVAEWVSMFWTLATILLSKANGGRGAGGA